MNSELQARVEEHRRQVVGVLEYHLQHESGEFITVTKEVAEEWLAFLQPEEVEHRGMSREGIAMLLTDALNWWNVGYRTLKEAMRKAEELADQIVGDEGETCPTCKRPMPIDGSHVGGYCTDTCYVGRATKQEGGAGWTI